VTKSVGRFAFRYPQYGASYLVLRGTDDFRQSEIHSDEPMKRKKSPGVDQIATEMIQQEDKYSRSDINEPTALSGMRKNSHNFQ